MLNTLAIMAATEAMSAAAAEAASQSAGTQAQIQAARASVEVKLLKHHIERLLMISEALWTMLKEQHGYVDDELVERVKQIDMRDGRLDGRVAPSGVKACPSCKRPASGRHLMCLYCGAALGGDLFGR